MNGRLQTLVDVDGDAEYEFGARWNLEGEKVSLQLCLARETLLPVAISISH